MFPICRTADNTANILKQDRQFDFHIRFSSIKVKFQVTLKLTDNLFGHFIRLKH